MELAAGMMTNTRPARKRFISFLNLQTARTGKGELLAPKGDCDLRRSRSRSRPRPPRIRPLLEIPVLVVHIYVRNFFRLKRQFVVSPHRDDTSFACYDLVEPSPVLQLHSDHLIPRAGLLLFLQAAQRLRRQRYHALHNSSMRFEFRGLRGSLNESRVSNYRDDSNFSSLLKVKSRQGLQMGTLVYRTSISRTRVQNCFSVRKARISTSAPRAWSRKTSPSRRPCQPLPAKHQALCRGGARPAPTETLEKRS